MNFIQNSRPAEPINGPPALLPIRLLGSMNRSHGWSCGTHCKNPKAFRLPLALPLGPNRNVKFFIYEPVTTKVRISPSEPSKINNLHQYKYPNASQKVHLGSDWEAYSACALSGVWSPRVAWCRRMAGTSDDHRGAVSSSRLLLATIAAKR